MVWQQPCRFKSIIILDYFTKWMGFTQCCQTQYQYPAAHSQVSNPASTHQHQVIMVKFSELNTNQTCTRLFSMSLTWNKAAVTLSLWGGGKLPLGCGFNSHTSCVSKMAKRLSRPRHSTDSVQCTNINESDRQPTAMLRIYFFLHSLSPLIKDFLDILFCINMWSMPLLRGYPPEHYFWHICSRQYN